MADRRHDFQFHDLVGQQPQTPVGEALRWRPQACGDDLRFLLAVEQFGPWRLRAWLAVEGEVEPQQHQSFANVLHRLGAAADGLGDLGVGPVRTVYICLQQDLGAAHLLGGTLELLDHLRQCGPFLSGETDDILLLHGRTLRDCGHHAKKPKSATP